MINENLLYAMVIGLSMQVTGTFIALRQTTAFIPKDKLMNLPRKELTNVINEKWGKRLLLVPNTYNVGSFMTALSVAVLVRYANVGAALCLVGGFLALASSLWIVTVCDGTIYYMGKKYRLNGVLDIGDDSLIKVRTLDGLFYLSFLHSNIDEFRKLVDDAKNADL